jgi:hypothetical protein
MKKPQIMKVLTGYTLKYRYQKFAFILVPIDIK